MRMRPGARALLACLGLACAGPPAGPGVEEPVASPPEATPSPARERFEAWKQTGQASDPRATFARRAEEEAERRRREALTRGAGGAAAAIEREMIEDQLGQLGVGGGGCFSEVPDLAGQDDWIRHRKLSRGDFRAPEQSEAAQTVVWIPFGQIGAYVAIRLACVVKGKLREPDPGRFLVEIERVEYLALLSRDRSWWNPDFAMDPEWILRHEQLHFDIAELMAQELTSKAAALHAELIGTGPDPVAAMADFRARWVAHLAEQQARFVEIEHQYDRETRHGTDLERQTEWFARVRRGLGAVRAGLDTAPALLP